MALTDNLVAYYKLDGNSNDSVGTNNGTDTAITYSTANGKIGQGAGFNGTTSVINFTDTLAWRPTGSFSISFWFSSTSTTQSGIISNSIINTGDFSGWLVDLNFSTGKIRFVICPSNGTPTANAVLSTASTYNDGNKHFVVVTYDGTTMSLFVDNIAQGTNTSGAVSYDATEHPVIGCLFVSGVQQNFLGGAVDEPALYNMALSASERTELYNGGLGTTWPFNTSSFFRAVLR